MARTDWKKLEADFQKEHAKTGIKLPDWCAKKGLSYDSARRHIKVRKTAQKATDKTAQNKTRKTALKKEPESRADKDFSDESHNTDDDENCAGTSDSKRKTHQGNPNPICRFEARNTAAVKHRGYAKYLDADELMSDAAEMELLDELVFTRARALSVTSTLKTMFSDLANAESVDQRIELYGKIMQAESALDRNVGRIESIERTLSSLGIASAMVPKLVADTHRIKAATLKLRAETDVLTREGKADTTPVSEIVGEIHGMNNDGLM